MVKAKIIFISCTLLLLSSCAPKMQWQSFVIDGHRTEVKAVNANNLHEALGHITSDQYVAPNERIFLPGSSTYAAAKEMIQAQDQMAAVKKVIAQSEKEMIRDGAICELSFWAVDFLKEEVGRITGKKIDVALINSGGIRVDMPKGDVLLDDILSMFPFKNYLCYVALKGEDLLTLFQTLALRPQPISGAKMVVDNKELASLQIAGEDLDPEKVYGLATIDFLLDGGDNIYAAKNAQELYITDVKIIDAILPYVVSYGQKGEEIKYFTDDRIVIK